MNTSARILIASCVAALLSGVPARGQFTVLHQFGSGAGNGAGPSGDVTVSGSTLYGLTGSGGGTTGHGTAFQMNTNGSSFSISHVFTYSSDGHTPLGNVTPSGSTLYGMTSGIDLSVFGGTVFKMNSDGTGFSRLHAFVDGAGAGEGNYPNGSLTLSGTTLYGMTYSGGANSSGVIFKIETNGTGFGILHEFAGGAGDGASPYGSLLLNNSTLYGMTSGGGAGSVGTVFKLGTDGAGFTTIHEFEFGGADGNNPHGNLTLVGTTLYGMTSSHGGGANNGTIFKLDPNGDHYTTLHGFTGGASDGSGPTGSLTPSGSILYGMTSAGGAENLGTIFEIGTDGSGFTTLHDFGSEVANGRGPLGSLALDGNTLYGMTIEGGANDSGIVFSQIVPEPGAGVLAVIGFATLLGARPRVTRRHGGPPKA